MTRALLQHAFQRVDRAWGVAVRPQQFPKQHPGGVLHRMALESCAYDVQRLLALSCEHA
jgi:hypothetical protein